MEIAQWFIISIWLLGLLSCKKSTPLEEMPCSCTSVYTSMCQTDTSKVNIRVKNATGYGICNFIFDPTQTLSYVPTTNAKYFGNIENAENSCYIAVTTNVYRIAWVQVTINNQQLWATPYDYIGEIPLEKGNYSFAISQPDFAKKTLLVTKEID